MYNTSVWTPCQKWPISVLLSWWKLVCDNHIAWPWDNGGDQRFLHGPAIPPPMWGSEDAHRWGFPLLVCKEAVASPNPATGPAWVRCLAMAGMPAPWAQACWQRRSCGRAGGTPALIHGWKQFECRQLPSPESISGLFFWQGIRASGPICWGWFCLKPKPLDLDTFHRSLDFRCETSPANYNREESVKTTIWNLAKCNSK